LEIHMIDDVILRRFEEPDEVREFIKGRLEIIRWAELRTSRGGGGRCTSGLPLARAGAWSNT